MVVVCLFRNRPVFSFADFADLADRGPSTARVRAPSNGDQVLSTFMLYDLTCTEYIIQMIMLIFKHLSTSSTHIAVYK